VKRVLIGLAGLAFLGYHAALAHAELRLYGVVIGMDGGSVAYLDDAQTGRVRAFRVGDSVGESQLVRIDRDRVVLQREGETVEVHLGAGGQPSPGSGTSEGGSLGSVPAGSSPSPLCPPFCPAPAEAGQSAQSAPATPPASLPCPPFCPAPAPADAGQPAQSAPPTPPASLPCPPFCVKGQP
jgi:hypothetical protein